MIFASCKSSRYSRLACAAALYATFATPLVASAHLGQEEDPKIYEISVAITGASIVDDDNIVGPAKLLFDYAVTPTDPVHDKNTGMTTESTPVEGGSSATFDPIEIYSHEQCGCAQDFKIDVHILDHSPVLSTAQGLVRSGINVASGFLTSPVSGGIALAGEIISTVVDYGMEMGSTDEAAAYRKARMQRQSERIGRVLEEIRTGCDPAEQTFTAKAMDGGAENGTLTYQVVKHETDRACVDEPVVDEFGGPDEKKDERPQCILETGKVLIDGDYHCPISAVPVGMGCGCREGYEWADLANKCDGCTKTKNDRCLEAVRATIEDGTGQLEPPLALEGEDMIKWTWGPMSCKQQGAVLFDTAQILPGETFKHREFCTNLEFVRGDPIQYGANCGLTFLWKYK